jgi:hypothetical protein
LLSNLILQVFPRGLTANLSFLDHFPKVSADPRRNFAQGKRGHFDVTIRAWDIAYRNTHCLATQQKNPMPRSATVDNDF